MTTKIRYVYLQFLSKHYNIFPFKVGEKGLQWEDRKFNEAEKEGDTVKFLERYWNYERDKI
jgi:hypothetical protein